MNQNNTGEIAKSDMLTTPLDRVITGNGQSSHPQGAQGGQGSTSRRAARVNATALASRYIDTPHVLRVEVDLRMSSLALANEAAARLLTTAVDIARTDVVPHPDNADDDVQAGRVARFHHENAPID